MQMSNEFKKESRKVREELLREIGFHTSEISARQLWKGQIYSPPFEVKLVTSLRMVENKFVLSIIVLFVTVLVHLRGCATFTNLRG